MAQNEQTSAEMLTLLANDQDRDVRYAVCRNSKTPKPVAAQLREAFLVQICTDGCKGSQPSGGRRFLFTLPQCPAKNFRSGSWLERMTHKGNQLERQAAAENLAR